MKTLLRPIAFHERSYNVNLLHKVLETLGLPVSRNEVAESKAEQDTLKQVRALLARLNLPIQDTMLLNEAASLAVSEALKEKGFTAASRSFTVTGTVKLRNGEVKKRQRLLAFDLDLKAAAVYRSVRSIAEIRNNGGFEFLGLAVSDRNGAYSITFYDWQYRRTKRKKADVVVYAVEGEGVIGSSRMINTDDYSDKGLVNDLDIYVTQEDPRTEYEILMQMLSVILKESRTSLGEIAESSDQLSYVAGELDIDTARISIASQAELLARGEEKRLSHELLYGIGRQNIALSWKALYKKQEEELQRAVANSVEQRIIRTFPKNEITAFLYDVRECAVKHVLGDNKGRVTLNEMLSHALPELKQRTSFMNALHDFKGSDFQEFWRKYLPAHPEFRDNPDHISRLLLTQQLTALTGDHQALVKELQTNRKLSSMGQLIDLEKNDWIGIIKKTGVPAFIDGKDDEEKAKRYAGHMQGLINAAFPTKRIAKMVEKNELPIEKNKVSKAISAFLSKNIQFDFAGSRIHDFDTEIKVAAGDDFDDVRNELMKIQRVFQVSTSPDVMAALMENDLHSAHAIAGIPQKTFIKTYGRALGGESAAFAVHQRASHISTKSEMAAMRLMEYSHGAVPRYAMTEAAYAEAMTAVQKNLPNYADLFGSPDICECEHCRSVFSASAYLVDLLRFLSHGGPNSDDRTPLDMLAARRPDLVHLPLTCENTNTIIPHIDLANEVMEYYTHNGSLANFAGYDTGEATARELRANPQHFNLEAYRQLNYAKYPFSLPYHQPLDVIRTYGNHLKVGRSEAMKAATPQPDTATTKAIEAESLEFSQEEYTALTGEAFDGAAAATQLHEYFGYTATGQLEDLSEVREFLKRSGAAYADLVELVKTLFINPYQGTLDFLKALFSHGSIDPNTIYTKLGQIESGTLDPADDPDVAAALNGYNSEKGTSITGPEFAQWITDHLGEFRQVITLYEPDSKCDLHTTRLRTMQSIYEGSSTSGISNSSWSKMHRFIRLWRKLGWTMHETDLMLAALGESDITPGTISKLSSVLSLKTASKVPLNQLAALWGNIDTGGDNSLYKKLFLNRAVQRIDEAFTPDAWGDYLQDETEILADHRSAILAAFRMTEQDLDAVLRAAKVVDNGSPRLIDVDTDTLNLQNLSAIYRHVALAKALKMRVVDLCRLISLFNASPFSRWDIQQERFTNISPIDTYDFYELAGSTKEAGFKSPVLEYILQGVVPAESATGLDRNKALRAAKAICDAFAAIERDHQETPPLPLTAETVSAKLSLTFQPEIVGRFRGVLEGAASFETITERNLNITIPDDLADRYTYIKGSGRLVCAGIMSDPERSTLKSLTNANANFRAAVDELYTAPESFIDDNFSDVFSNSAEADAVLLDHPAQAAPKTFDEKLSYVYAHFLPLLKSRLRQDAVTRHIAALIGLSEEATGLLIADDIDALIAELTTRGFSATYFSDADWNTPALERVDGTIDFSWGATAPGPSVPADNFSVGWRAYIAAPASAEYTFIVEVEETDEAFKLYLDDTLVLSKQAADTVTSWEIVVSLNAAQLHLLKLDYAEAAHNAGIRLLWKTAVKALEVVPASVAYPAAILDAFADQAAVLHRAAKFISGFGISETELDHFIRYRADFGDIDFKALEAEHWKRIRDYTTLRNAVPQARALLTDVFALANISNPSPDVDKLTEMLSLATAWDKASLEFLIHTHFSLGVDDFKNERALNRVYEVMKITTKTGMSAETIAEWGGAETDFDTLHETGQLIKNAAKAKYEEDEWLEIAGNLSNEIREHQKQALIDYLLVQPAIQQWGAEDADGLFEHFLIDVQMGSCMDSSRVVQAISSVQMFVSRCLLNLESAVSNGAEKGVSPGAVEKDRWEWMKNYRVWEADRKIFLYPENWLEPEWRSDRSEFFKELESYLVQNDITDRSVEQGFRNYLRSLNEVANPEVCGMCRENHPGGGLKYLHVFARTHNAPYKFFYRRWNEYGKWSAWEKVQLDIRSIEDGDDSGVHLIPVVWKKRLFLFWPEFLEKQEEADIDKNESVKDSADNKVSDLERKTYWQIRLAWSEYVDDKWTPKQLTKEFIRTWTDGRLSDFTFRAVIGSQLSILFDEEYYGYIQWFQFSDIQSKVETDDFQGHPSLPGTQIYSNHFMKRKTESPLILRGYTYLQREKKHKLVYSHHNGGFESTLSSSFFYHDAERTYFVRPVDIKIIERLRYPEYGRPYFMEMAEAGAIGTPSVIPDSGPYAYTFTGGTAATRSLISSRNKTMMLTFPGDGGTALLESRALIRSGGAVRPIEARKAGSKKYEIETSSMEAAFGAGINRFLGKRVRDEKGLEFHTFYHPFSSDYVTILNERGLPGLMGSDTDTASDEGAIFEQVYQPNFWQGLVQKPSDFGDRTYYKENVCFDVFGANSLYNWELFFHAPLYIATRLSKNGKYEEAMKWFHYIFDPFTDEMQGAGESEISRYWKVAPFKTTPAESLEDWFRELNRETDPSSPHYDFHSDLSRIVSEWRDNPFDPHLVASNRPLAYMKHVVIKYVENLIAWGDSLFRRFTRESVNEALQIYVIANHILGPKPEFVPKRGEMKAESYHSLRDKWDDFSNALVQLENIFPFSSEVSVADSSTGANLLGIGPALYFGIPANDTLLGYWDTVADRLFKIRHCRDIDGVERKLALFAPPISPEALIKAASQGLSLGSILADLGSPPPIYRFSVLIQKANEFCAEVKALGSALLAALEKKDGEELNRLRASHETTMLELMTAVRDRQVLDANANKQNLQKARETAAFRLQHYIDLLGNETITVPSEPAVDATLTADSQLPPDTSITAVQTDVDTSLVDSDESGVKMIPKEKEDIDKSLTAIWWQGGASSGEALAGILNLLPNASADGKPFGIGAGVTWGGSNWGAAAASLSKVASIVGSVSLYQAGQAAKMASYIRREQDWTLQANLAAREIIQLDKQITSADIRIQVAEKELENHKKAIENAREVGLFLEDKFTNQELYQWMKEQLFAVYKESYNLAFDMAKKAEKAYQYETGTETANFIQYGYWDNSMQGLAAGEKLQLALRQLEKSYLEENRRELELTKSVSLAMLDPLALIKLRETGKCSVSLPEELFDLDFPGHYFRRIKSVSLSLPCIAGPFTTVNCSLRLLRNTTRVNTSMNSEGNYEHENDEGLWIDDERFRTAAVQAASIAVSTGQNDAGMFEFSFRDERYLPFEGAGAISDWEMELSTEKELRQFNYSTISDVVLHLRYTARENSGLFKEKAVQYIKDVMMNRADLADQPFMRMFSMKHEFPGDWHKFLHPASEGGEQVLNFSIGKERFPFFAQDRAIIVMKIEVFAKSNRAGDYHMILSYTDFNQDAVVSSQIAMPKNSAYGGLNKATINVNDAGLALEELDITGQAGLKVKHSTSPDYTRLAVKPAELEDIFLVVHYKMG